MYRFMSIVIICFGLLTAVSYVQAAPQCDGHGCAVCPNCHNGCTFKAECGKEEKSCWEVECEEICIPCVVFPWQKWRARRHGQGACDSCTGGCDSCADSCGVCSSVNNGVRVKTVKKLKKKSYECPKCKYTWTPSRCGNGDCCDAGCCDAGCSDTPVPADAADKLHEAFWIAPATLDTVSVRSPQKNDDRGRPKTGATCSLSDN